MNSFSIAVRCGCTGPDGKPLGQRCPQLWRRDGKTWTGRHGSAGFTMRIPTSAGIKLLRRSGYESKDAARDAALTAGRMLDLAGTSDATRAKIGDLLFAAKRGAPLPTLEEVAQRVSLRQDPGSAGVTFGDYWTGWLADKRRLRASSARRLEQIGRHCLLPVLADTPLSELDGEACKRVFRRILAVNAEIGAQRAQALATIRAEGDLRERSSLPVGVASQHRVFAALREVLNHAWRVDHKIKYNPVYAASDLLEPEYTPEAKSWSAAQAQRFLAHAAGDEELGLMFRVAVIGGARRGELVGLRWAGANLDAGYLTVTVPVLMLGGKLHEEERGAKSRAGRDRRIWLDAETIRLLREHRDRQYLASLEAADWHDHDLIFCQPDGSPHNPDRVYRRFRRLAAEAGVPVIKLHEGGRHTNASLANDAGVNDEIRRKTLGHSDAAMTSHYTHIQADANRAAAEALAPLVDGEKENGA